MGNRITLIHVDVPMPEPFRISSGEVHSKESIVVRIERDGLTAYGEASPMAGGFYSNDTPESTWDYLSKRIVPQLIHEKRFEPGFAIRGLDTATGNRFAWAGIEGALWDLHIQETDGSFPQMLDVSLAPIPSGLAVGIYPTIADLLRACERHLEKGYKRLKIKIEPGWDIEPLRAIRERFGAIDLMVDANAAYREEHFPVFDRIDEMGLLMIEQPLSEDDLDGHARLQQRLSTPICLDESIKDLESAEKAIEKSACRIINLKIQRLGGLSPTRQVYDFCAQQKIPTWMGTMPELGIGALQALYFALLPNCSYPTDVESSARWFVEDLVDPPIEVVDGYITIPKEHQSRPTVNTSAVEGYTIRQESWEF